MKLVCKDCGTVDEPKTVARGSMAVEIVLWLLFIVPGLIYSIWRLGSKHDACRACGSEKLLPVHTPAGRTLAEGAGYTAEVIKPSAGAVSAGRALGRLVGRLKR
ncbi:hypothetical protein ACINB_35730 [Acidovorax sp. NB1]|nr:hypothetical protein ACINB_35730 [Acidovorax sp. NB1]